MPSGTGGDLPWVNRLDFRFAANIPTRSRARVELTMDVLNLLNLFDKSSGEVYYAAFNDILAVRYAGVNAATGKYRLRRLSVESIDIRERLHARRSALALAGTVGTARPLLSHCRLGAMVLLTIESSRHGCSNRRTSPAASCGGPGRTRAGGRSQSGPIQLATRCGPVVDRAVSRTPEPHDGALCSGVAQGGVRCAGEGAGSRRPVFAGMVRTLVSEGDGAAASLAHADRQGVHCGRRT